MTKDEALRIALEALEINLPFKYITNGRGEVSPCYNIHPLREEKTKDAITALRQAIEQAEAQEPVANIRIDRHGDAYIDQYVDLPTGEHEVYTAPPQREWVGLTDEELEKIDCVQLKYIGTGEYSIEGVDEFALAIEAKLKEKNT